MKKIEAFIRPEKLEDIKIMLQEMNLNGLSVSQVMGCGNQKGWKEYIRDSQTDYNFLPKVKIELFVTDEQLETVVDSIIEKARTGKFGDGKIFVSDVTDAVRIRTKERGVDAIK